MKIVDLKCAVIGKNPIVRIVTDQGLSGFSEVEQYKPYLKPYVLQFRDALLGEDPTDVERVILRIRQRGAFKPWGAAGSAIEMALWDLAGKAAGLPVYKLLGGKVRDRVRVYNGALRTPMTSHRPEDYAAEMRRMKALPEGFTMVKQGISFHSPMKRSRDYFFGEASPNPFHGALDRGLLTERGMAYTLDCVAAMKDALGDEGSLGTRVLHRDEGGQRHAVGPGRGEVLSELLRVRGDRRVRLDFEVRDLPRPMRVRAELGAVQVRPSEQLVADLERVCGQGAVKLR